MCPEATTRIGDEIAWARQRLAAVGVRSAGREATRLWASLAGIPTSAIDLSPRDPAMPDQASSFRAAVDRAVAGEPMAYLTGAVGFRHLVLGSDRRALIPRPETEGIVDLALAAMPAGRALDLGTGTGCLALALADEGDYGAIVAVDRSEEALALARSNGMRTGLAVRWLCGDWTAPVLGEQFDLVVTNPPYVSTAELVALDQSVRDWEPRLALDGGPDGLAAVRRLLAEVPAVLAPDGLMVMEIDSRRSAETAEAAQVAGWSKVQVMPDLFGRARYLTARREN